MPHYKVKIEETAVYTVRVEAKNEVEAAQHAEKLFLDSISVKGDIETEVPERDVIEVKKVRAPRRRAA